MNSFNWRKNIWQEYLIYGFAFSIVLTLINYKCDGPAHIMFVLIMFALSGVIGNLIFLSDFIRRYKVLFFMVIVWSLYFLFMKHDIASVRMTLSIYISLFAGFCISRLGKTGLTISTKKLCIMIGVFLFLSIFWHRIGNNAAVRYFEAPRIACQIFSAKLIGVYLHPASAACAYLCFTLLALMFLKDAYLRFISVAIGITAIWLSASRFAIIVLVGILAFYYLVRIIRKDEISGEAPRVSKGDVLLCLVIASLAVFVFISKWPSFYFFIHKVAATFATPDLWNASISSRSGLWSAILKEFSSGSILQKILGRGRFASFYYISNEVRIPQTYSLEPEGACNAYLSMLFDYGIVGLMLMLSMLCKAIFYFAKGQEKMLRRMSLILLTLMTMGLIFDIQYWNITSFFIFSFAGMHLGTADLNKSEIEQRFFAYKSPLNIAFYCSRQCTSEQNVAMNALSKELSDLDNNVTIITDCILFNPYPYDIIHYFGEDSALFCWISKLTGKKVVCHIDQLKHKNIRHGKLEKELLLLSESAAAKFSDKIIVTSRELEHYF